MDTFLEMQTALLSDLNISSGSSLFPLATRQSVLNRAYIKCGRLFRWPQLQDAKKTSTQKDIEYYDSPEIWSPNSIWRLEVDGIQWGKDPDGSPISYDDYMVFRSNSDNANSTDKNWAQQWLRYFIFPVPAVAGSNNISIWGQMNVTKLEEDEDPTIFSYNMPECNEAVVLEASAMLKNKGENEKVGQMVSAEAKQILLIAFNKIRQEQAKFEKIQPFFNVPDLFGKANSNDKIGNF